MLHTNPTMNKSGFDPLIKLYKGIRFFYKKIVNAGLIFQKYICKNGVVSTPCSGIQLGLRFCEFSHVHVSSAILKVGVIHKLRGQSFGHF